MSHDRLLVPGPVRRALRHVAETGGFLPDVDPVDLKWWALDFLVAKGWATRDAAGWLATEQGVIAHQRDVHTK